MAYCQKCGKEVHEDAEICMGCGCRIKNSSIIISTDDSTRIARFLLTFFLGWIGSIIINHTDLKPKGWTSRSYAYFFLSIVTFGIYSLFASICNFTFNPNNASNIGYFKD